MAAKVGVDVVVDSAAFTAFFDTFQKYRGEFEKMPETWKGIGRTSENAKTNFEQAANSLRRLADNMDLTLRHSRDLSRVSEVTSRSWKSLARDTASVAGNITTATLSLLKWAGITGIVGGLLGGGTLLGIDRLGADVSSRRTASLGTGSTYGGYGSFATNFGRFGDPEGVLARINEATHDTSKRVGLLGLGLSNDDLKGNTEDVAAKAVLGLKRLVDRTPDAILGNVLQSRQVPFDLEYALRLKKMSKSEVEAQAASFRKDKKGMSLGQDVQKKWQDFSTQMSRAGVQIENTLVKGLVKLEPGLAKLSGSLERLIANLLKEDGPVSHWLGELDHGLEWLAGNIDTPEFQAKVNSFINDLGDVANTVAALGSSIAKIAHWFGSIVGVSSAQAAESNGAGAPGGSPSPPQAGRGASARQLAQRGMFGHPHFSHATAGSDASSSAGPSPVSHSSSNSPAPANDDAGPIAGGVGGDFNVRGFKNRNPGNIAYGPWAIAHGATGAAGKDQDHQVAVFPSYHAGLKALDDLANTKYGKGKHSADALIAGDHGWTPGNHKAAVNVARGMGIGPFEDMHLDAPGRSAKFHDSLMSQELGPAGARAYHGALRSEDRVAPKTKVIINKNTGGNPIMTGNAMAVQ